MGQRSGAVPVVNKMDLNETAEPICYNSTYQHGVDEKRRVQIPAKWRPAEPGTELTLVLWPKEKEGTCLRVLPPQQLAKVRQHLNALENSDPRKVVLKRFIGSESVQVPLDKAGRICLPEKMAREAGLTDEAMLVGLLDFFEIWSPARYEKVMAANAVLAQEAFKLME
jgi:MraZ protein